MGFFRFAMPPILWFKVAIIACLTSFMVVFVEWKFKGVDEPLVLAVSFFIASYIIFVSVVLGIQISLDPRVKRDR